MGLDGGLSITWSVSGCSAVDDLREERHSNHVLAGTDLTKIWQYTCAGNYMGCERNVAQYHNILLNSVVFGLVEEPMNIGFPWISALFEFRYGSLRVNHNVPHPPIKSPSSLIMTNLWNYRNSLGNFQDSFGDLRLFFKVVGDMDYQTF